MMATKRIKACGIGIVLGIAALWTSPALSTQTEIWTTRTFDDFQRGETENISMSSAGTIELAPQVKEVLTLEGNDLLVWSMTTDTLGNLYIGTGEQGRIFKISPTGENTLFFDSPEIGILSLAVDADNTLYAGTAPDGLIYKITPDGSQTTFFMTEEHYVWSLAFGPEGELYAGTGDSGKIFKILPDGSGSVFYDSAQTHVMSLLYDPQGRLYAGTEGQGMTYRIDLNGEAFTLYQAEEEEIHALALDTDGTLYLAALSNQVYPMLQGLTTGEQPPGPKGKGLKSSAIYQIQAQGTVTKILDLPKSLIYAMTIDGQGRLLVGTDDNGRVYHVLPNGERHQLFDVTSAKCLSFVQAPDQRLYIGTGDTGAVYQVVNTLVEKGEYLSLVHDAQTISTWGKIFWEGTPQQVMLFTRTGNTDLPDNTWSAWSEALQNQDGTVILSPAARFIQWKAQLLAQEQQNAVLNDVSVAYLPHNLAPKITQVATFHARPFEQNEQKTSNGRNGTKPSSTERPLPDARNNAEKELQAPKFIPSGYIAVVWQAEDPNNEEMSFTVALQGNGERAWNVLEEDLASPLYMLDSSTLPDGEYVVKISASDSPANPPAQAFSVEKISERFEVDNTAPQVTLALNQQPDENNGHHQVIVVVQDSFSRLKKAEYALDAEEWQAIFPDDLVTDSRDEKYSITLPELEEGQHILSFKVADQFNNVGFGKIQFTVEETPSQP